MRLSTLKKRLGDILVNVGLISEEQLTQALYIQKQSGGKLGKILAQMGAVNEEVMLAFLGKQCGISYVSLREYGEITEEVLHCLPEDLARTRNLIPISKDGNKITVAMSDPFNILAIDDIKFITGYDVKVVIASEQEIRDAIDINYRRLTALSMPGIEEDFETGVSVVSVPVVDIVHVIVGHAIKAGATHIYLEPQGDCYRVRYRMNNVLQEQYRLSNASAAAFVKKMKTVARPGHHMARKESIIKMSIDGHDIELQASLTPTITGDRVVMQYVRKNTAVTDITCLGLDPAMLSLYERSIDSFSGIIVISGPRKSGCSTTLYATLSALNQTERDIAVVDTDMPVPVRGVNQSRPDDKIKMNDLVSTYIAQTPDVFACGNMADRELAHMLFRAAFNGQNVLATMAANSVSDTLQRIRNFGVDHSLIASTLLLILNQRLMRTICPECKIAYDVPVSLLAGAGIKGMPEGDRFTLWRGEGCARCNGSGYAGQTGVFEMWCPESRQKEMILQNAASSAIMDAAKGFTSLQEEMWKKVSSGISTVAEYLRLTRGQEIGKNRLSS